MHSFVKDNVVNIEMLHTNQIGVVQTKESGK